jgi:signal transduction histidine kinase/ActR/RegA family two-component response regulator
MRGGTVSRTAALSRFHRIMSLITLGTPISEVLEAIIYAVEEEDSEISCSIYLLNQERTGLKLATAPSLPPKYRASVNEAPIARDIGSCPAAAYRNERVICEDLRTDPRWEPIRHLIEDTELRACWSQPIRGPQGQVLGTFAIYKRRPGGPTAQDVGFMEAAAELASLAIGRVQAETALQEARQRAEAAAEAKTAFLANMSHELRTPLTSIIGFSRLLHERHDMPEEALAHARRIFDASEALLVLINDVLDFSKLEAGHVEIEPQPFAITQLVEEVRGLLSLQAAAKGIALEVDVDEDALPAFVSGDSARLRQVLVNLTANAVKFTAQGNVTLRARYDASGEMLSVDVADTGPGIPPEALPKLFERFSQANVSINRTHGGTGLGLAICKAILDVMGGSIGAESELGKGSTFSFQLPAPLAAAPVHEAPAQPVDLACPPLSVLLVDDTAMNRQLVKLMLGPLELDITEGVNGAEAIRLAEDRPFDLILMDIRMPEIDGLEATRTIRAGQGANRSTRIVALTADVEPENLEACRAAGIDGVLPKPISPEQLLAEVCAFGRTTQRRAAAG